MVTMRRENGVIPVRMETREFTEFLSILYGVLPNSHRIEAKISGLHGDDENCEVRVCRRMANSFQRDPSQPRRGMTQQSGGITPESICRQRGGGSVNDSGSGGFSGGHSSGGPSRLSDTDLHQVTQASHQTAHIIVQDTSSKSVSQASSSSEFPEKAHFQMAQQLQQFPILSEGSPGQAIQSMNNADPSSKSVNFPLRPGKGTFGVNCVVKAYRFFTELSVKDLYHYHVSITPDVTKSSLNRAVMEKLVSSYKYSHLGSLLPAYDGFESLYTAGPLPFASNEFEITLINDTGGAVSSRKEMKFTVMIGFASHTDPHNLGLFFKRKHADVPQKALEVLDIVMCQKPTSRCTPLKRSFSSLLERGAVDDELEAWSGSYQNIHPTEMCLSLNIDKSASVFAQPLEIIDFVAHILNRKISARPLSDSDHLKIKKALKGLKVEVTHQGNIHRKYRISGITSEPTRELTFSFGDSGTIKHVVQYFQETYGMKLKHTALPSLLVGNKQRRTYLPMEVCKISDGQRLTKILNVKKVENLVKLNYQRPHKREDDIIKLKYHDTGSQKIFQPQGGWWSMMNKRQCKNNDDLVVDVLHSN
ncbi:hypothetical protein HHK36_006641 [Tetracentron sinense]|uniref:PAZ domain-containing protein n=1 Tax=Tetracentron sinense TaxID=13715 RepID=A0A835DPD3_TETSI|nr:hypothetical protein HHK36_006641 [Tetracentron sinense]